MTLMTIQGGLSSLRVILPLVIILHYATRAIFHVRQYALKEADVMIGKELIRLKKKHSIKIVVVMGMLTSIFLLSEIVSGISQEEYTHLNKARIKGGCNICHDASGRAKAGMLRERPVDLCLKCHGPSGGPELRAKSNIFMLITKRSSHRVLETAKYHMTNEVLPERDPSIPRHVSCLDCHNVHMVKPDKIFGGVRGTEISGRKKQRAEKESEVCYNCHSDSINLPASSSNLRLLFDPSNASYHPVERVAKGRSQSLFRNISQGSLITCTHCHEPHGSDYAPMLRSNYNTADGPESLYAYELCYTCHDRDSILSNKSFRGSATAEYGHKEHIVYQNTSCYTCHASHGSSSYPHLVKFNASVVTGLAQYLDYSGGRAQCNLTCHGRVHR